MTQTNLIDIWRFPLRKGNSHNPREGACLLDAVSWLEYGTLGDHPPCVCPVIAAFGRGINDAMNNIGRQRLVSFIPRLVGTVDPKSERARAEYLAWQVIRVFAPLALDVAGLHGHATRLREFKGTLSDAAYVANAADAAYAAYAAAADAAYAAYNAVAYDAANAAYAAAYAANTANAAAYVAAYAAAAYDAADAAAAAGHAACEDAMIAALDGVLRIGRQAEPLDVPAATAALRAFEIASA